MRHPLVLLTVSLLASLPAFADNADGVASPTDLRELVKKDKNTGSDEVMNADGLRTLVNKDAKPAPAKRSRKTRSNPGSSGVMSPNGLKKLVNKDSNGVMSPDGLKKLVAKDSGEVMSPEGLRQLVGVPAAPASPAAPAAPQPATRAPAPTATMEHYPGEQWTQIAFSDGGRMHVLYFLKERAAKGWAFPQKAVPLYVLKVQNNAGDSAIPTDILGRVKTGYIYRTVTPLLSSYTADFSQGRGVAISADGRTLELDPNSQIKPQVFGDTANVRVRPPLAQAASANDRPAGGKRPAPASGQTPDTGTPSTPPVAQTPATPTSPGPSAQPGTPVPGVETAATPLSPAESDLLSKKERKAYADEIVKAGTDGAMKAAVNKKYRQMSYDRFAKESPKKQKGICDAMKSAVVAGTVGGGASTEINAEGALHCMGSSSKDVKGQQASGKCLNVEQAKINSSNVTTASTPPAPAGIVEPFQGSCASLLAGGSVVPSAAPKMGHAAGTIPSPSDGDGKPAEKDDPNKWLNVKTGVVGSIAGAMIGTFFTPFGLPVVGVVAGALAGYALFWLLSKITN